MEKLFKQEPQLYFLLSDFITDEYSEYVDLVFSYSVKYQQQPERLINNLKNIGYGIDSATGPHKLIHLDKNICLYKFKSEKDKNKLFLLEPECSLLPLKHNILELDQFVVNTKIANAESYPRWWLNGYCLFTEHSINYWSYNDNEKLYAISTDIDENNVQITMIKFKYNEH